MASAVPGSVALTVALLAHALSAPEIEGGPAAAAATPWLTLPLATIAVSCCLTAARIWPLFARRQPGADAIRRLERGPFGGRAAMIVGALLAQCAVSLPLTIALAAWLGAPSAARHHYVGTGPADAFLRSVGDHATFELGGEHEVTTLLLRPRAALPTSDQATEVAITNDNGEPLATTPVAFADSGALLRVAIAPQTLSRVRLTKKAGHVPLWFHAGSVVAVSPATLPTWGNSMLAALLATWSSLVTLILAALIGAGSGWATLATTICCAQFVQWIGGVGPIDDALLHLMRGQWLL